jgi:uncharacterized protein YbaR (Trm112 family)
MMNPYNPEQWPVICPITRQKLQRRDAGEFPAGALPERRRTQDRAVYWVTEDGSLGYPEVGGIPVLLERQAVELGARE